MHLANSKQKRGGKDGIRRIWSVTNSGKLRWFAHSTNLRGYADWMLARLCRTRHFGTPLDDGSCITTAYPQQNVGRFLSYLWMRIYRARWCRNSSLQPNAPTGPGHPATFLSSPHRRSSPPPSLSQASVSKQQLTYGQICVLLLYLLGSN